MHDLQLFDTIVDHTLHVEVVLWWLSNIPIGFIGLIRNVSLATEDDDE
jgi:hypothetical protein